MNGRPAVLRFSANLSMLYSDLPVLDRPEAAANAGFSYVETWWPFDHPAPTSDEVNQFCATVAAAGVRLVSLNLDAGDPAAGERGLLSLPDVGVRITRNLDAAVEIVRLTHCPIINALWGNRLENHAPASQDGLALRRLVEVADRVADVGATVVIETLNTTDSPAFPLTDIRWSADVVRWAARLSRHGNIGLLLDTYHLATMGTDPADAIHELAPLIRHVQFADSPGRGRPGTGDVDFAAVERALIEIDYQGFVGLEYDPRTTSQPSTIVK